MDDDKKERTKRKVSFIDILFVIGLILLVLLALKFALLQVIK